MWLGPASTQNNTTVSMSISTSILHCFDVMCLKGELVFGPGVAVWYFVPFLVLQSSY